MAVSNTETIESGIYTPYFQRKRGGEGGQSPVGSVYKSLAVVGAAGGGGVTLNFSMGRLTFGFRAIIVPTLIVTEDTLATAEVVKLNYVSNNRRINVSTDWVTLAIAGPSGNFAKFEDSGLILEREPLAAAGVLGVDWSTNTDTKSYAARMFAAVFDAELIEKEGSVSDFLAGVR